MKTTVELDFSWIDGRVEEQILERAASDLLEETARDSMRSSFRDRISTIRDEILREKLTPIIDEAIQAPIYPTNAYGERKGEAITLREYIIQFVQKQIKYKAEDSYGSRKRGETIIDQIIREEVHGTFKNEAQKEVKAAAEAAKKAVTDHVASVLRQTVEKAGAKLP